MNFKRKQSIFIILLMWIVLLAGCGAVEKEFTFNEQSAGVTYYSDLWKEIEGTGGPMLHYKHVDKVLAITGRRVSSIDTEENYVGTVKSVMEQYSVDGTCLEETFEGNPMLTFTKSEGDNDFVFSVIFVQDGAGFYEVTFMCFADYYEDYKEDAFDIMSTFKIIKPSDDVVVYDSELYEGIKELDKMAGHDKDAVIENLSSDGIELVGIWGTESDSNFKFEYFEDGTFSEKLNEEEISIIIKGTWSYDSNTQIINHTPTSYVRNDEELINEESFKELNFEVMNFQEKEMQVYILESGKLMTVIKIQ